MTDRGSDQPQTGNGISPSGDHSTWRKDPKTGEKVWTWDGQITDSADLKYGNGDSYSWATE